MRRAPRRDPGAAPLHHLARGARNVVRPTAAAGVPRPRRLPAGCPSCGRRGFPGARRRRSRPGRACFCASPLLQNANLVANCNTFPKFGVTCSLSMASTNVPPVGAISALRSATFPGPSPEASFFFQPTRSKGVGRFSESWHGSCTSLSLCLVPAELDKIPTNVPKPPGSAPKRIAAAPSSACSLWRCCSPLRQRLPGSRSRPPRP